MPAAARISDAHVCPKPITGSSPPVPHGPGTMLPGGSPNVNIGRQPALRQTDKCICPAEAPLPNSITTGSSSVNINGLPAIRLGDSTEHGGQVSSGFLTVNIGG